jgi:hypothetical protein
LDQYSYDEEKVKNKKLEERMENACVTKILFFQSRQKKMGLNPPDPLAKKDRATRWRRRRKGAWQ